MSCPECGKHGRYVYTRKYLIDYHCKEHGYFKIPKVQTSDETGEEND